MSTPRSLKDAMATPRSKKSSASSRRQTTTKVGTPTGKPEVSGPSWWEYIMGPTDDASVHSNSTGTGKELKGKGKEAKGKGKEPKGKGKEFKGKPGKMNKKSKRDRSPSNATSRSPVSVLSNASSRFRDERKGSPEKDKTKSTHDPARSKETSRSRRSVLSNASSRSRDERRGSPEKVKAKSARDTAPSRPTSRSPRSVRSNPSSRSCDEKRGSPNAFPQSRRSIHSERSGSPTWNSPGIKKLDLDHIREGLTDRSHKNEYRRIRSLPGALVENRVGRTVLSRPRKEVLRGTKRRGVLPRSHRGRRSAEEQQHRPIYIVEPRKRYRTTYVDMVSDSLQVPRMRLGGRPSLYNNMNVSPRAPGPLPGRRKEFTNIRSRLMEHLPPEVKLPDKEKIVLRNTKLCYSKKIGEWSECDHFIFARELRAMNAEHAKLMRLTRLREVGDTRGPTLQAHHAVLRRKARVDAENTIQEACDFLESLESMSDPMNAEREHQHWRLAVADRRLAICDAMDAVEKSMTVRSRRQAPSEGGAQFVIPTPKGLGNGMVR